MTPLVEMALTLVLKCCVVFTEHRPAAMYLTEKIHV